MSSDDEAAGGGVQAVDAGGGRDNCKRVYASAAELWDSLAGSAHPNMADAARAWACACGRVRVAVRVLMRHYAHDADDTHDVV